MFKKIYIKHVKSEIEIGNHVKFKNKKKVDNWP